MDRYFLFDNYNTWSDWNLILTSKDITPAEVKENLISLDGMSGSLDLTEVLTGEPTYNDRIIVATFWTDHGTRQDRVKLLRDIRLALHGRKVKIVEPDDTTHYFIGRVKITKENNILPYAELEIEITCEPWRYAINESTRVIRLSTSSEQDIVIYNGGAKTLSPTFTVTRYARVIFDGKKEDLYEGTYILSDCKLKPGFNIINLTGLGEITITYREADL